MDPKQSKPMRLDAGPSTNVGHSTHQPFVRRRVECADRERKRFGRVVAPQFSKDKTQVKKGQKMRPSTQLRPPVLILV